MKGANHAAWASAAGVVVVTLLAASVAAGSMDAGPRRAADVVVFSDGEFRDGDWALTVLRNHTRSSARSWQVTTGGNPGAYRRVYHVLAPASPTLIPQLFSLHQRRDAVYRPSVQGPIRSICYQEDAFIYQGFGQGQRTGPAIWQGGRLYVAETGHTGMPSAWQHRVGVWTAETDFVEVRADAVHHPGYHPDFSAAGAPITFGFHRGNTSRTSGYILDGAIDNWRLEVNCLDPTVTPTATARPSATTTPTPTVTATTTPTPTALAPTPTPTDLATPSPAAPPIAGSCICPLVPRKVPRQVIEHALANPERYGGWNRLMDENKPGAPPFPTPGHDRPPNPRRTCLDLQNPNVAWHPMLNTVLWRAVCASAEPEPQ